MEIGTLKFLIMYVAYNAFLLVSTAMNYATLH